MRIDRSNPVTVPPRETAAKPTSPPPAKDVVNLSAAGSAAGEAPSPAAADRIARIRALVQQGAYPIDLDMLASRIVHDEILRSKGSA